MSGWLTPMEPDAEMLDHVCGRCRTPFGVTNPGCPNRPLVPHVPVDGIFTDEEAALILAVWSAEL